MTDLASLWDFDDPAGSEQRLRDAVAVTSGDERAVLLTQVARALGLQGAYDAGHGLLDRVGRGSQEVAVRVELERGRLLRSAGDDEAARLHFEAAAAGAESSGSDALRVDALHMLALVVPVGERVAVNQDALGVARGSADPAARAWEAPILNNIGMEHADVGDFDAALSSFTEALAARRSLGDPARTRVARWMVAWALRNLGRGEEALAMQRELKAELSDLGEHDPHVDEELALLE